MKKRILSAVIAVCMMIGITGCTEQDTGSNTEPVQTQASDTEQTDETTTTMVTTTAQEETRAADPNVSDTGYKSVDFEQVFSSCEKCSELLQKRYEYEKNVDEFYKNTETYDMNKVYSQFYEVLKNADHVCSAKSEYVKNYPYTIGMSRGLYTGSWKGCGPDGEGEFIGTDLSSGGVIYSFSYKGSWKSGLPNGNGDHNVWVQEKKGDSYAEWNFRYKGEMKNGFRNGEGVTYVVLDVLNSNKVSYGVKGYVNFDTARFVNNKMQGTVDYYEYINDKLVETGKASNNSSSNELYYYIDFPIIPTMTAEYTVSYEDETQSSQTEQVMQNTQKQTVTQKTITRQAATTKKTTTKKTTGKKTVSKNSSKGKEILKNGAIVLGAVGVTYFGFKALSKSIKNDNAKLEQWMKDSAEQSRKSTEEWLQKDKEAKEKAQKDREAYEKRQQADYNWGMYKKGLAQGKDKNSAEMREYYNKGRIPA